MTSFLHSYNPSYGLASSPPSPPSPPLPLTLEGSPSPLSSPTSSENESDPPALHRRLGSHRVSRTYGHRERGGEHAVFRDGKFHPRASHAFPVNQLVGRELNGYTSGRGGGELGMSTARGGGEEEHELMMMERGEAVGLRHRNVGKGKGKARERSMERGEWERDWSAERERGIGMEREREREREREVAWNPHRLELRELHPPGVKRVQSATANGGDFLLDDILSRFGNPRREVGPPGPAKAALERLRREREEQAEKERRERAELEEKERREREVEERRRERKRAKKERQGGKREARGRAFDAVRRGDLEGLRREVGGGGVGLGGPLEKEGETMLMIAAGRGDVEVVRFLLDNGADAQEKDVSGKTAFHLALLGAHIPVVRHFLAAFPPAESGNGPVYAPPAGTSNLRLALQTGEVDVVGVVLEGGLVTMEDGRVGVELLKTLPEDKAADISRLLEAHFPDLHLAAPASSFPHVSNGEEDYLNHSEASEAKEAEEKMSRKQRKLAEKKAKARARAEELGLPAKVVEEAKAEKPKKEKRKVSMSSTKEQEVEQIMEGSPPVEVLEPVAMVAPKAEAAAAITVPIPAEDEVAPLSPMWSQRILRVGTYSAPPRYVSLPDEDEDDSFQPIKESQGGMDDAGFQALPRRAAQIASQDKSAGFFVPQSPLNAAAPQFESTHPGYTYAEPPSAYTDHTHSPYSSLSFPHTPSPPVPTPSPHAHLQTQVVPFPSWQTEVSPVGGVMTGGEKFLFGMLGGGPPTPPEPMHSFPAQYEPIPQGFYEAEGLPPPPGMGTEMAFQQHFEPYMEMPPEMHHHSPYHVELPISPPPVVHTRTVSTSLNAFAQPFVPRFNTSALFVAPPPSVSPPREDQTPIPRASTPPGLQTPPYVPLSNTVSRNSTEASSPVAPNTPAYSESESSNPQVPLLAHSISSGLELADKPATLVELARPGRKEEQVYTVRLPGSRSASQSPAPTVQAVEEVKEEPSPQVSEGPLPSGPKPKVKKWYKKSRGLRGKGTDSDIAVNA